MKRSEMSRIDRIVCARKYLVEKAAVCSECVPAKEYDGSNVDAWAKQHVRETGHIVTIHETHDVSMH